MSHRDSAILAARELLAADPLFLDTETTGLGWTDEVVEIGIIDKDGNTVYHSLVNPTCQISEGARAVHNISDEELCDAPRFGKVNAEIKDLLEGRTIIIYNADFDIGKIQQSALAVDCLDFSGTRSAKVACAMKLYAKYYGDWNSYRHSYRWQSLENAIRQCGIKAIQDHRALGDCELTRQILLHMAAQQTSEEKEASHA